MSIAVASVLMQTGEGEDFNAGVVASMRQITVKYPRPMGGYGGRFRNWLVSLNSAPTASLATTLRCACPMWRHRCHSGRSA